MNILRRMPRLGVVIASVREGRVGRPVADWFIERARTHGHFEIDEVDLKVVNLPIFAERNHPRLRKYESDHQKAWSARVGEPRRVRVRHAGIQPQHRAGAAQRDRLSASSSGTTRPWGFVSYGGISGGLRAAQMVKLTVGGVKMVADCRSGLDSLRRAGDRQGVRHVQGHRRTGQVGRHDARRTGPLDHGAGQPARVARVFRRPVIDAEASRRQPVGNRHPLFPRGDRAGPADGRRLHLRGPLLVAPLQGGRGVPDRPAKGGEPVKGVPRHRRTSSPSPRSTASTRSIPATGSSPRTPSLARACDDSGHHVRRPDRRAARNVRRQDRRQAARAVRRTCRPFPAPSTALGEPDDVEAAAKEIGYPVIIKASFGGGGRGMRVVEQPEDLAGKARRGAGAKPAAAFGQPEVFVERYIPRAKHIEVQILGDAHGNLVHLWERDCSVQRRHQKVVEIAPSRQPRRRTCAQQICDAAVAIVQGGAATATPARSSSSSTSTRGEFYFIEVNPRIQVEHTVTEVVTGIDIVKSQILVAAGPQAARRRRSTSRSRTTIQTQRLRAPVPHHDRRPGEPASSPTTAGSPPTARRRVRRFGSTAATASAARSSRRTSTRCWSRSRRGARRSTRRVHSAWTARCASSASAASRPTSRSSRTCILHPTFVAGEATTTFIDDTPELFQFTRRATARRRSSRYLGDVIVNGRPEVKGKVDPKRVLPEPVVPRRSDAHAAAAGHAATSCRSWARRSSPSGCASRSGC